MERLWPTSAASAVELPPDAAGLFSQYRKRKVREVQGFLTNLLFIRIPIYDPDRFLNRWVGVFGKIFTKAGFVLWLMLLAVGGYLETEIGWQPGKRTTDVFHGLSKLQKF